MSQNVSTPANRPPRWQFSLRELLTFTAIVGVQLAAYLSLLRSSPAPAVGRATQFSMSMLPLITCLIICLIVNPWRNRKYTRSALFRLRLESGPRLWLAGSLVPPIIVLAADLVIENWFSRDLRLVRLASGNGLMIMSTMLAFLAFPRGSIYLCEPGIVVKGYFVPWSRLQFRGWDPNVPGLFTFHGPFFQSAAVVPLEQCAAVAKLLEEKLPNNSRSQQL